MQLRMDNDMQARELKQILAKHGDLEEVSIGLNFFDRTGEHSSHPSYICALESKLKRAYDLLTCCKEAIDYFAKKEEKEKDTLTYYEGRNGYNEGYKALKKDVHYFIDNYSRDMLRMQIENG